MKPDVWQRVKQVLHSALEDPAARETVLAEACAHDAELCREVTSLLEINESAGNFIEEPAVDLLRGRVDGRFRKP